MKMVYYPKQDTVMVISYYYNIQQRKVDLFSVDLRE
jgi:hypothetical protein